MVSSVEGLLYPDTYRPSERISSDGSSSSAEGSRPRGSSIQFCWNYARHGECSFYSRHGRCQFSHELPNRNEFYKLFPDQSTYPPQWYYRRRMAKEADACSPPSEPRKNTVLEDVTLSGIDGRSKSDRPPKSTPMPLATPDDSISDETSTRAGLEPSILPPPESLQGPHGDAQNTAVVGSLPDAIVESSPIGSSTGPEVTNDTPGPAPSRQLRERKPRVPSVSSKRASDPGDPFEQMSGKVQRKRLGAVKTLEQAWSEKQDEWLPRPLWAAELCVNGDPDQLKPPRDWDTRVLVKLSKVAELTPRDLASAQSYLQEAGRHHGFSWDDEPTAAGITMHKLREVLKSAHRLAACAPSSGSLPVAQGLGGEGTARPPRAIGSSTCKGPECSDVDDEEPPMLLRQGIKRELSEGSQESIVVTGTGPNKRLRTDPQPRPQPEPQPRAQPGAQLEPPANASDRFRLELEEATEAAELAAARFDMLEKNRRVQRLRLQLSS